MEVTILICSRDRAAALRATLAACAGLETQGLATELLVVDNASSDETATVVAAAPRGDVELRTVVARQVGKSHALNVGVEEARGRVLLFADDDIRPPVDWAPRMVGPILAGEAEVVGGGVRLAPELERPWMTDLHRNWLGTNLSPGRHALACVAGANMALPRDLVLRLGGFDPRLGPGPEGLGNAEDTLLVYQARAAGARFRELPEVVVEHHVQPEKATRAAFLRAARARGRSDAYIARHWEHRPAPTPLAGLRARLRLAWEQARPHPADHATPDEIWLTKQAAYHEQFAVERRLPAKYPRCASLS